MLPSTGLASACPKRRPWVPPAPRRGRPCASLSSSSHRNRARSARPASVTGSADLRNLSFACFAFNGLQTVFTSYFVIYLTDLGYSLAAAGLVFSIAMVLAVPGRILWGWVGSGHVPPRQVMGGLALAMAASAGLSGLYGPSWPVLLIGLVAAGMSATAMSWHGVLLAETARLAPEGMRGAATGGVLSFGQTGALLMPLLYALLLVGAVIAAVTSGRAVTPTTPAFIIGDVNQLEVVAQIDSTRANEQLKEMYEGMPVIVTPNLRPDLQFTGKIRQLPSPYGTGNRDDLTIRIVLDESPSPQTYQAGDDVTIQIVLADKSDVLWLPPDAIRQMGGRTFVVIPGENGPQRVEVEIGLKTFQMVEILSGLQEGQVVFGP